MQKVILALTCIIVSVQTDSHSSKEKHETNRTTYISTPVIQEVVSNKETQINSNIKKLKPGYLVTAVAQ